MGTRCNIQVVDQYGKADTSQIDIPQEEGVLLYNHWDSYPTWMVPTLARYAERARSLVSRGSCMWWDSDRVAAIISAWSVGGNIWPSLLPDLGSVFIHGIGGFAPWDESSDQLLSEHPELQNGAGYGVPSIQPTSGPACDAAYWYQLVLYGGAMIKYEPEWTIRMYKLSDGWQGDLSKQTCAEVASFVGGRITIGPFSDYDEECDAVVFESTEDFLRDCAVRVGDVLVNIPVKRTGSVNRNLIYEPDIAVPLCDCGFPLRWSYRDTEARDGFACRYRICYECGHTEPIPISRMPW
jgi:hypothetical protein